MQSSPCCIQRKPIQLNQADSSSPYSPKEHFQGIFPKDLFGRDTEEGVALHDSTRSTMVVSVAWEEELSYNYMPELSVIQDPLNNKKISHFKMTLPETKSVMRVGI